MGGLAECVLCFFVAFLYTYLVVSSPCRTITKGINKNLKYHFKNVYIIIEFNFIVVDKGQEWEGALKVKQDNFF